MLSHCEESPNMLRNGDKKYRLREAPEQIRAPASPILEGRKILTTKRRAVNREGGATDDRPIVVTSYMVGTSLLYFTLIEKWKRTVRTVTDFLQLDRMMSQSILNIVKICIHRNLIEGIRGGVRVVYIIQLYLIPLRISWH